MGQWDRQRAELERDGHVTVGGLLTPEEVARFRDIVNAALPTAFKVELPPWHQDQWYWPLDTDRTITMWLPLHDVEPEMGELAASDLNPLVGAA